MNHPAPRPASAVVQRRHVLAAGIAAVLCRPAVATRPADAVRPSDALRIGVNAGVSFAETEDDQRRRYAGLVDSLGRGAGQRIEFGAVYSDRVTRALASGEFHLLLVHTHAALKAERDAGWRVLAFSDDRRDNRVLFFVRPDDPARRLTDLAGRDIGSPGAQSWASATARSLLHHAAPARPARWHATRLQDVVPFMVQLRTVDGGICRSQRVVDDNVAAGRIRVVHRSEALPLYALIASPHLGGERCDRLCDQAARLPSAAFDGTPMRALAYSDAVAARLRGFFSA